MNASVPACDLERRVRDLEARLEEVQEHINRKASEAYRRGDLLRFRMWRDVASELFQAGAHDRASLVFEAGRVTR